MLALSAPAWGLIVGAAVLLTGVAFLSSLLVRGSLTIDLGWGRRFRPLGPITIRVEAPRELVFEQISSPYLGRAPRSISEEIEVVERGAHMALAAHHTKVRWFTTTTLETVRFTPPERVDFRLVRGPVPHVIERFLLREIDDGTELEYAGELGADLWGLGRLWGRRVARAWERAVQASLGQVKAGAEERAAARERRSSRPEARGVDLGSS